MARYRCELRHDDPECQKVRVLEYPSPKPQVGSDISISRACPHCGKESGWFRFLVVKKVLGPRDDWPWKKHKGRRVEDVIRDDVRYVLWATGNDPEGKPDRPLMLSTSALKLLKQHPVAL